MLTARIFLLFNSLKLRNNFFCKEIPNNLPDIAGAVNSLGAESLVGFLSVCSDELIKSTPIVRITKCKKNKINFIKLSTLICFKRFKRKV